MFLPHSLCHNLFKVCSNHNILVYILLSVSRISLTYMRHLKCGFFVIFVVWRYRSLFQVSGPPKPSTTSMGEMTTADVSNRPPAVEDPKCSHATQPKAGLPDTPKATGSEAGPPGMPEAIFSHSSALPGAFKSGDRDRPFTPEKVLQRL